MVSICILQASEVSMINHWLHRRAYSMIDDCSIHNLDNFSVLCEIPYFARGNDLVLVGS